LLLAVGAAGAGWWYAAGRWATTPSLYELTAKTAVAKGKSAGVNVVVGTATNSSVVPQGEVVTQSPESNHRLLRGGTVTVHLSSGPVHYTVPAFTAGTTTDSEYQAALSAVHLTWVEAPPQNDPTIPSGDVLSVSPAPGASLVANTPVTITVSSGPAPIAIPDYTGKPATEAQTALTALGFNVATPTQDYSTTVPAGSVISQSPDTGTAQAGATISLDVSKGPQLIAVPNVTNEKTAAAEAALSALGFKYFLVRAPFGPGVVYAQSPAAGSMKPPGTTVTLDIL
jgi:eukaryotic-like serine/threonine-protein kinase